MSNIKDMFQQASYKRKLKQMVKNAESTYGKGYVLHEIGRFEEALVKYDEAAAIWEELQQEMLQNEMEDEAENAAKRELEVRFNKCFILFKLDKKEEALAIIEDTIQKKPDDIKATFSKGFILFNIGQYEEALRILDKAISLDPEYPDAWCCKANTLYQLERFEEALESYEKAIEFADIMHFNFPRYSFLNTNPDPTIKTNASGVWYCKANTLEKLGKHKEAIEAYNNAIEIKPAFSDAWYCMGNTLEEMGENEDALRAYSNALEVERGFTAALENKANLLFKLGREEEAKELIGSS